MPAAGPGTGSVMAEPCHDTVRPSSETPGQAQPHGCSAQYASAGAAKIDVPQLLDLPALEVEPRALPAPARDVWIATAPPPRAAPPPLTILHCCLRT